MNYNSEKYIRILANVGLPEKATRIYLCLLENGQLSISDIVKNSRLHRPEVYKFIPALLDAGLISEIQKGKRLSYIAESPNRITELIREFESRSSGAISELQSMYEKMSSEISVKFNRGKKGVTNTFNDILDTMPKNGVFYRISAETDVDRANTYLPKDYRERRDKKQLQRQVIMSSHAAVAKKKRLERDLLVIPESRAKFQDDVTMTIYEDKVAYIDFAHENAIIIENPLVANFQKTLFKLLYKQLQREQNN